MSLNYLQNNCVCLPQYSSVQTPIGSEHIKEPQTSLSLWADGTDYGVCLKLMTVCMHVSVTAITFSDGSSPPSLTSLFLLVSVSPLTETEPPEPRFCHRTVYSPLSTTTIYHHLPSELHATFQASADTQETPNNERHAFASGLGTVYGIECEMIETWSPRDFYRLVPFMSLWCSSELGKAWRTWGREKKKKVCAFRSCWDSSVSFVCFILLFLKKTLEASTSRVLVGTTYCRHVTL